MGKEYWKAPVWVDTEPLPTSMAGGIGSFGLADGSRVVENVGGLGEERADTENAETDDGERRRVCYAA